MTSHSIRRSGGRGPRWIVAALVAAGLTRAWGAEVSPAPAAVVAYVKAESISPVELEAELPQHRAAVAAEFAAKGRDFDDSVPRSEAATVVRERASAALARLAAERALFRQYGVSFPADYAAVVEGCARENQRRAAAVAQGGVFFGPKRFSVIAWRDYLHSNARIELVRRLVAVREIVVADKEVETRFRALQAAGIIRAEATLEECRTALRVQLVDEHYRGVVDERVRVAGRGLAESGSR